jgi:hypothetical protein
MYFSVNLMDSGPSSWVVTPGLVYGQELLGPRAMCYQFSRPNLYAPSFIHCLLTTERLTLHNFFVTYTIIAYSFIIINHNHTTFILFIADHGITQDSFWLTNISAGLGCIGALRHAWPAAADAGRQNAAVQTGRRGVGDRTGRGRRPPGTD